MEKSEGDEQGMGAGEGRGHGVRSGRTRGTGGLRPGR